jgi:hypothetical protein
LGILAVAFCLGMMAARRTSAANDGHAQSGNREQFAKSADARRIPEMQLLQDEAVKVWKEYAALPNKVPY